jgi:zinc transport system substrate-binding protein
MKKYIIAILIVIGGLGVYAFFNSANVSDSDGDKISVVSSFYPLYFFASEIGGEHVNVRNITPAGVEPHDYEPTPQDVIAIEKSDVLVLNGAGFEPWSENVLSTIPTEKVVIAGEAFATLEGTEDEHEERKEAPHEDENEEHLTDPHVWLSPALARRMAERIRDGIIAADPENESDYRANADDLIAKLTALDSEFKNGLQLCARRDMITSHAAFAYIARDYNLRQVAISGLSPEEEPSAQELAEIVEFARQNNVKYIFFETLVPAAFSETVASEIGAQTLVLNPLEGLTSEEQTAGKNYFTEMRQNLTNLKIALQCR